MPPGTRKILRSSGGPRTIYRGSIPPSARSPSFEESSPTTTRRIPFRTSESPDLPASGSANQLPSSQRSAGSADSNSNPNSLFVPASGGDGNGSRTKPQPDGWSSPSSASDIHPSSSVAASPSERVSNLPRSFAQARQERTSGTNSSPSVRFREPAGKTVPPPRTFNRQGLNPGRAKRRVVRDSINGISAPAIRRLARRGGVKRISSTIYHDIRKVLRERLTKILQMTITVSAYRSKLVRNDGTEIDRPITVMLPDVLYALRSFGTPVYGFEHLLKN